ncbi:MAG: hypothetical protein NZZ41_01265 [Candidatus Dojkabacteria bacterium]|nr:hypothetical protein [Candidatus Dojkabacteria bacterium]
MNETQTFEFMSEKEFEEYYTKLEENFDKKKNELDKFIKDNLLLSSDKDLELQIIETHSAIVRIKDILIKEKITLNKLKLKYERIKSEEYERAKQNPFLFKTLNEFDRFVIRSSRITKMKSILDMQTSFVEYVEYIFDILKSKKFDIKNILEIRKTDKY